MQAGALRRLGGLSALQSTACAHEHTSRGETAAERRDRVQGHAQQLRAGLRRGKGGFEALSALRRGKGFARGKALLGRRERQIETNPKGGTESRATQ